MASSPARVPEQLEHSFSQLQRSKPILTEAASPNGHLVALLENTGTLILFRLTPSRDEDLHPAREPVSLRKTLWKREISSISTSSLQLINNTNSLCLFAVHV